jgi:aspartyl/asparaginyl beta-hydroxylase (cupin superfamily)
MFLEASCFPSVVALEDNWKSIREEYNSISSGAIPYLEEDLYRGEWDVFPFRFFEKEFEENQKRCPKTWKALKEIPDLVNAAFSILRHDTDIHPHTGFTKEVLRCHLGLHTPSRCLLVVGDEPRRWVEGKALVFDDTLEHYAYNHSDADRVVLLLDFKKDGRIKRVPSR